MKNSHYQDKSIQYGIGHTRRARIISLAGDLKGKRVLDIGCASGYLGRAFKERGAVFVAGIDISESAAKEAGKYIDKILVFDIEGSWPSELNSMVFDVINLSEVLEHVFDPVNVLKKATEFLSQNGIIIITTPNFMTWTNRIRFLLGDFKYQDQGMFDFGHIRWFTYKYLKEVIENSNLKIDKENHIVFPGKLTFLLKYFPSFFAFQFILRIKKIK